MSKFHTNIFLIATTSNFDYLFAGQTVLDLGCGWGSVALYVAENYPESNVYALSNSSTQKKYIMDQASAKGLDNLSVFTGDVSIFENEDWSEKFDRIISIGTVKSRTVAGLSQLGHCVLKWNFSQTFLGNQDATLKLMSELISIRFC